MKTGMTNTSTLDMGCMNLEGTGSNARRKHLYATDLNVSFHLNTGHLINNQLFIILNFALNLHLSPFVLPICFTTATEYHTYAFPAETKYLNQMKTERTKGHSSANYLR